MHIGGNTTITARPATHLHEVLGLECQTVCCIISVRITCCVAIDYDGLQVLLPVDHNHTLINSILIDGGRFARTCLGRTRDSIDTVSGEHTIIDPPVIIRGRKIRCGDRVCSGTVVGDKQIGPNCRVG